MTANDQEKFREDVFSRVQKILIGLLKIYREKKIEDRPQINWDTDLVNDLGVDSLEILDLMNALEEEFQISPNLSEANTKTKIYQVVDYILSLLARKNAKK